MGKYHPHGDTSIYDALVAHGAGLRAARAAGRRARQLRLARRRRAGGHALHRGAGCSQLAMRAARRARQAARSPSGRTTTARAASRSCCRRASRTCSSTASQGIAVGMATNIPPHNLGEVIDACVALIDDRDARRARPAQAHQGPGLPDRRAAARRRKKELARDLRDRPGLAQAARRVEARGDRSAAARRS